ncbi:MAG: hypothetical protein U0V18_06380 [Anaerolineales bacterium]
MLNRLSNFFYSLSTGWVTLTGLLVFVLFMIFVLPQQAQKAEAYSGGTSPDTSYIYSARDLYQMAEEYGVEGRSAYIYARFTFDLVFPLAYLFFLTTSISWLLKHGLSENSRWRMLNLFPLAGAIFDYLENISTSLVLGRYPSQTPVIDVLAPVFTAIKWFFVNGSFVLLLVAIVLALWKRLRR